MNTFKINAPLDAEKAYVELNGKRLEGVRSVSFNLGADRITTVELSVIGEVVVNGEFLEKDLVTISR